MSSASYLLDTSGLMEDMETKQKSSVRDISVTQSTVRRRRDSKKRFFTAVVFAVAAGFVIGILIGRYAICPDRKESENGAESNVDQMLLQDENPDIGNTIIDAISSENIRAYLR